MSKIKIFIGDDDNVSDIFISDNPGNSFIKTEEKAEEEIKLNETCDYLGSEIDNPNNHNEK